MTMQSNEGEKSEESTLDVEPEQRKENPALSSSDENGNKGEKRKSPPPKRKVARPQSNLPDRGLGDRMSFKVPHKDDVKHEAKKVHGPHHWKVEILDFLHDERTMMFFNLLLVSDVIILFVELFLQATYPVCSVVERDAISCCPIGRSEYFYDNATNVTHDVAEHFRFLAEDDGHGDGHDGGHNLCSSGEESYIHDATCDPHKWSAVHTAEEVFFSLTITILSLFMLELVIMASILQKAFFRQIFYVLDMFIVSVSLVLELVFHFAHEDLLQALSGLLVFFRIWRFVRIGHGLIEVTAEYSHRDKEALWEYAESLEHILHQNELDLPEMNHRVKKITVQLAEERSQEGGE